MRYLILFGLFQLFSVHIPGSQCWTNVSVSYNCHGTHDSYSHRIASPYYPSNYGNYQNCYWLLTGNAGTVINIFFDDFNTEPRYDFVRVYDGSSSSYNKIGEFSGYLPPNSTNSTSSSNQMYITFRSDGSGTRKGFSLTYNSSIADVCNNYKVLNDPNRSRYHYRTVLRCDRDDLTKGWYRFTGAAGTQIATSCVPKNHCDTHAAGWMNGLHPSVHEGIVSRTVCYHWDYSCCNWRNTIQVKNCGSYYVYELDKTPNCWYRYCGNGIVSSSQWWYSTPSLTASSTLSVPTLTSSIAPTSTQRYPLPTTTQAAIYPTTAAQDGCSSYTELSSVNRSRDYATTTYESDYYLAKGWYRFTGAAGTQIATSCVPIRHCNTYHPGWMSGSHPTVGEGIVSRTVYFSYSPSSSCWYYSKTIRVKNCGGFFVYELDRSPGSNLRYCGNGTGPVTLRALDFFISLTEKIERLNNNKPMTTICSYIRKLVGYDDSKWTTLLGAINGSLPHGILTSSETIALINMIKHGFSGRLEQGVVYTPYGDVAMGPVITGICAGLNTNRNLWFHPVYQIFKPLDNLFLSTLAGDLGLTSLVKRINPSLPLLGPSGVWSPNTQCPKYFHSSASTFSMATDAQIRGGIDGFLLGYKLPEWIRRGVRLSQLLRMYYKGGVVYDREFAACRRMDTFRKIVNESNLAEQTTSASYAVKSLWNNSFDFSSVQYYEIPQLANNTVQQFYSHSSSLFSRYSCPVPGDDEGCSLSANIVFVLDESGSIGSSNYEVEKNFVKKIIEAFEISPYAARVAVVEYANYAYESISLRQHSSKSALLCAVDKLTFASGGTATNMALQTAYNILRNAQSQADSHQANDPQIIILLTDGHSNGGISSLRSIVDTIKRNIKGLTMVAVGVGSYNLAELQLIATDPNKHVLSTHDFNQLIGLAQQLKNQTCNTATDLKPDIQSVNASSYNQTKVTGYLWSGKPRYFKLDSVYIVNIRITITSYFGTLIIYGSWSYDTPDENNNDFKYIVYESQWSSSNNNNGKTLVLNDICKGHVSCHGRSLSIALVGGNSSNSCSDQDCSVPDQIKFEIFAVYCSCSNGGTCRITSNGSYCSCPPGYTGKSCDSLDVCNNYTELSSASRSRYHATTTYKCDNYMAKGWYRFTGAAGTHIATSCVPWNHCNTYYSGWMSGSHPTVGQGIVSRSVCFSYSYWSCCYWSKTIRVKNCGGFYVYELDRPPHCNMRYCGNGTEGSNCVNGKPCYNGGTCHSSRYNYYCTCPTGYTGRNCETNLMVKVNCKDNYMEVSLYKSYFPNTDWRDLHLNNPSCRATVTSTIFNISTPFNGCGTVHKEDNDTIVFENKVMDDKRHTSGVITRDSTTLLKFHCKYSKRKVVSTSFNASKEIMHISEGNFGNFTFMMNMYKSDAYQSKYTQNEYPVSVALNQMLWIRYKVLNTIGDLVVFAETCRATLSTNPYSYPYYEFLKDGCAKDSTMIYRYNPSSSVQQFSIKSFRFLHTNNRLVYLHCHLMVCHRNSANSRCSRGCIGSRRRRRGTDDYDDTSKPYDLSTGPITGEKIDNSETDQNKGSDDKVQGMAIGLGVLGGVLVVIGVAVILKCISAKVLKSRKVGSAPAYAVKTSDGSAASQANETPPPAYVINAFDGPAAFQLDEMTKARELEL